MAEPPRRKHTEVLRALLPLAGRRVLDIGCGDGGLLRYMTRQGARATGVEISEQRLAKARAAEAAGGEDYLVARGEALPLPDASFDAVVYFNALHHVPPHAMAAALGEAARVLSPTGRLYVAEPLAQGPNFQTMQPIEDETEVRHLAKQALDDAVGGPLLRALSETDYLATTRHPSFEDYREGLCAVDPRRAPTLERLRGQLEANFRRLARPGAQGFELDQPMRVDLLERRA